MIVSIKTPSYLCRHSSHSRCKNKRNDCGCSCHPKNYDPPRRLKVLRDLNIVPKNYCSNCKITFKKELDVCKNCNGLLRKALETKFIKKVYFHCMGTLESELYRRNREKNNAEDLKKEEILDVYYYAKTKAWWTLRNENKIKRFLRSEKSSNEFLQKAGKEAVYKKLRIILK